MTTTMTASIPLTSILLVCLGNICRSPAAEAVMRAKAEHAGITIRLDSAGTAGYHIGSPPDKRAIAVGKAQGYDLSTLRARQATVADFYEFALIFAMDSANLAHLQRLQDKARAHADGRAVAELQLFDETGASVADPYYGDERDFATMFAHLEQICDKRLSHYQ